MGASTARPLASRSRYSRDSFSYPDPMSDPRGFREALACRLRSRHYALVYPVTDRTIGPLMQDRESIERHAPIAMASNEAISLFQSKSRTNDLASQLNVPTPPGIVVDRDSELDLLSQTLDFPVVLKPDRSKVWSVNGVGHDLSVTYAATSATFLTRMRSLLRYGPVLVQERVLGDGVGLGVLAHRGESLFVFQYRRIHEVPLSGGASSYRVSEEVDSQLADFATSMMKEVGWSGPAMVEFKHNPETAQSWLIEVNGRFWGSLPLPVAAGADFPFYVFNLQVRGSQEIPRDYGLDTRCRNLERELLWLRCVLKNWSGNGLRSQPGCGKVLLDSMRVLNPREHWDTLSISDPVPGITNVAKVMGKAYRQLCRSVAVWLINLRMRRAKRDPRKLHRQLERAHRMLIVCRGNIIRSAFATGLMNQRLSFPDLAIDSAGVSAIEGTSADPTAVTVARSRRVDLSDHSAQPVDEDLVGGADLIVAMEAEHIRILEERFPEARHKTFLLGCFGRAEDVEIPDPDYQEESQFNSAFDLIEQSLESMVRIRRGSQTSVLEIRE